MFRKGREGEREEERTSVTAASLREMGREAAGTRGGAEGNRKEVWGEGGF